MKNALKAVLLEFTRGDNELRSILDSDGDTWDVEMIDGSYWRYCSGGTYPQAPTEPNASVWVDWKFFEDRGESFSDELKAGFMHELPVIGGQTDPFEYCIETDSGYCYCKYCGPLVDDNMNMCDHLMYMREGTDSYAGCGNDDYRYVRYAWRFIPFKSDALQEIKDKSLSFGYRLKGSVLPDLLAEIAGCDGDLIEHDDYHEQMAELYRCEIDEEYFDGIHRGLVFLESITCKEFWDDEKAHAKLLEMLEGLDEAYELAHRPMLREDTRINVYDENGKLSHYQTSEDYWDRSVPHEITMPKFVRENGRIEIQEEEEGKL